MGEKKNELTVKYLNVGQILKDKNPSLAKKLPRFIIRILEKLVKQDDLNAILKLHGHKSGVSFIEGAFDYNKITVNIEGAENIPTNGRFTFAGNHPLGGTDGLALAMYLCAKFPGSRLLANDILMNITSLADVFLPINKHGGQVKGNVEIINDFYASDCQMIIFPAGLVSRKSKGVIKDLVWKKNFVSKSVQYKRDIIPVHISGKNTMRFYRMANFRKLFNIKVNLEMFLLPSELIKLRGQTITLTFGEPIPYTSLDRSKRPAEWASEIKEIVYKLEK